ncbi:MAG: hypothetical protein MUD16_05560 [Desulfobacterales bacterium]|nr:hypothetical protein [Desulfobacterales bacterium]
MPKQPHTFHIPVMGTGFTIDTPLKVARFGISSVISLVDDILIEQVRQYHCERLGEPFAPIAEGEQDCRALRITAYLDLVARLVERQVRQLRAAPFEEGSEITRYFRMLPNGPLKTAYERMLAAPDGPQKERLQAELRPLAVPGSIDVNIMTKLDADSYRGGRKLAPEFAHAMSALRGFARSTLSSAIVFSAGINQRLYRYAATFEDFFAGEEGDFKKTITLKVSDFHSAEVQGKFLAKRGLWVSEFRIESGLNCGGHAFATDGHLLGPVLEEFRRRRSELEESLRICYLKALEAQGRPARREPDGVRVTVQGGIGTADENDFLLRYYQLDGTGWGTPFLLVPEATNVDRAQIEKLLNLRTGDVYLSDSSPLGVPFWNLRTSTSEEARRRRNEEGRPGSPCPKGYAASNTDFSDIPLCIAARTYIRRKLGKLPQEGLSTEQMAAVQQSVLDKSCLCNDLAGGALLNYHLDEQAAPAICCGPNIVNFSKLATLEEMVGHIYGRLCLITNSDRPHMFVAEIRLYIEHLRKEASRFSIGLSRRQQSYFSSFKENLLRGVDYYHDLARQFIEEKRERFVEELESMRREIEAVLLPAPVEIRRKMAS